MKDYVRGDIGGFGLGSQFSWQAVAPYSYAWQFTGYQIAAVLGFRALAVNYTSGSGVDTLGIQRGLLWADHRRKLPLLSLPT